MSIWVRTFCRKPLSKISPDQFATGIAKRLKALITHFHLENAPPAATIMRDLRVEDLSRNGVFSKLRLRLDEQNTRLPFERWTGTACEEEVNESLSHLADRQVPEAREVESILRHVCESIACEVDDEMVDGLGSPLAVAAAAYLAEIGDGVIEVQGAWMLPSEHEIRFLLDPQ